MCGWSKGNFVEEQLSLIDLVLQASFTVQAVMAMLMLASVVSWYMIVQRFLYFRSARDEMYDFEERFWSGIDLSQLYREGNERASEGSAADCDERISARLAAAAHVVRRTHHFGGLQVLRIARI